MQCVTNQEADFDDTVKGKGRGLLLVLHGPQVSARHSQSNVWLNSGVVRYALGSSIMHTEFGFKNQKEVVRVDRHLPPRLA